MRLLYLIIFIHVYFNNQILCFRSTDNGSRRMAEKNSKTNSKSRKNERFNDIDIYSADYSPSESGTYYEDDAIYNDLHNFRDEMDTGEDVRHYETKDLNTFSDEEVTLALSMLTENELDRLDRLIDDDDQQDAYEMVMKREINHAQIRKRECQDTSCSQMERGGARAVRNPRENQLASFRSWFTRNKTTKTTRRTTTPRKSMARTLKTSPSKKSTPTRVNDSRQSQRFISDNNNILRYDNNKSTKDRVDKNVRDKINFLTSRINRAQKSKSRNSKNYRNISQHNEDVNRHLEYLVRRKRNSIVTGSRGTLEDSFPHPNHETDSFHNPIEPLVRVKRDPFAV